MGAWIPFAPAAQRFTRFTHLSVSPATVRRLTEAVGLVAEALDDAQAAQIADTWPDVPAGPATAMVSVDGAMVPLVGGVLTEAKTLVVGQVDVSATTDGVLDLLNNRRSCVDGDTPCFGQAQHMPGCATPEQT